MEPALKKFILFFLILFSSEQLLAQKNTKVFFNNDDSTSYVDPYRAIRKQGSNLEDILIRYINKAKKSVYVAVQELNLTLLSKSLVAAKNRGVDVKVILEDTYNRSFARMPKSKFRQLDSHMKSKVFEQLKFIDNNPDAKTIDDISISNQEILDRDALPILKKGGVPIKDDSRGRQNTSSLMHHKFVIIDQKILAISSANFTRSGVHGDFDRPKTIGNANALMLLNSKNLSNHFLQEFKYMWKGVFKKDKPFRGFKKFKHDGQAVGIHFSPTSVSKHGWENSTNGTISKVIKTARREFVSSMFTYTSQRISNALGETRNRFPKLEVEMLIDPTFATRFYSGLLDMWGLEMRNSKNCRVQDDNKVWERRVKSGGRPILVQGDKLHHKFAVIDRETVIFGSHNWSDAANYVNDESLIVIKNRAIAREFVREHNRLYRRANIGPSKKLLEKINDIERGCRGQSKHRRSRRN